MAEPPVRRPPAAGASPSAPGPTGFATRAIRAAHRLPVVDQAPTSVPIYQTVTFSSADAEELGAVTTRAGAGLLLRPPRQPDRPRLRLGRRRARGRRGGLCLRLRDGRDPRGDRHARLGRRPGRRRAARRTARRAPSSRASSRRLGVRTEFVDVTDLAAVEAALATAPTRILYAETISNPTIVVADHAALAELAHRFGATVRRRQHVRLAVPLPAGRARRGSRLRIRDEVPRPATPT